MYFVKHDANILSIKIDFWFENSSLSQLLMSPMLIYLHLVIDIAIFNVI